MIITVTHVTRMHSGRVCVAGVDIASKSHVRPVMRYASLDGSCLEAHGGVFDLGSQVDLGSVIPCGHPPEVEDCYFDLAAAREVGRLKAEELWSLLGSVARNELTDIFGSVLQAPAGHSKSLATPQGQGVASLGVWRPPSRPRLVCYDGAKVRLECDSEQGPKRFTVTDTRFLEADLATVDARVFRRMSDELRNATDALLCVGLTRPWAPGGAGPPMHWMQVNGIHPAPGLSLL